MVVPLSFIQVIRPQNGIETYENLGKAWPRVPHHVRQLPLARLQVRKLSGDDDLEICSMAEHGPHGQNSSQFMENTT